MDINANVRDAVNCPIRIVEPQMEDVHHAPFNAALLHTVALAFPATTITFEALPEHLHIVRQIVAQYAPDVPERIQWQALPPARGNSLWARWKRNAGLIRNTLARRERILFCSISRMQLLQLKRTMGPHDDVRAVLHGDLDQIERPRMESFPKSLFALDRVLQRRHPRGLRYVLLSDSIRAHLPAHIAAAMRSIGVIDHPYHFPAIGPIADGPPVFGTFGNTGDGRLLEAVARTVKQQDPTIGFSLIGFLSDDEAVERLRTWVDGVTKSPISRELFEQRADAITHALWLAEPDGFRLRASGTFFDALAHGKPLIYTRNPFIDSFGAVEAGIGVSCATVDDVPPALLRIAAQTEAAYAEMQTAILRFRVRFSPEHLAEGLPAALDWN